MKTQRVAVLLVVVSTLWTANFAEATNFWKNRVLTGSWSTSNNWSATSAAGVDNAGVPTSEPVYIAFTDGAVRTVTYDVAAPSIGVLSIDLTGPGVTTATLSLPGAFNLNTDGIIVGGSNSVALTNGRGTLIQTGGTVTTSPLVGDVVVGYGAGSTGVYTLSGGSLINNLHEYIGLAGAGTFNQSAGSNSINASASGFLSLGHNLGATGAYNLSGAGALTVATPEYIGFMGTGSFTQSGGSSHTISGGKSLYLGYQTGSSGSYTLSNTGTLAVSGPQFVGYDGTGTFTQSGGSNGTGVQILNVGYNASSNGTYTLSGTGVLSTDTQRVGDRGTGTFNQIGGTNTVYSLRIGHQAGSMGAYTLSAGTLTSTGVMELVTIGYNGTGSFSQSGGSHTNVGGLIVGRFTGSSGAYTLSGGPEYVGYEGAGTFTQSGGSNSINGGLFIGKQPTGIGTYTLIAGVMSSGGIQSIGADGGAGTFNQSGGRNIANQQLQLGSSVNAVGTYNLSGGTLTTLGIESVGLNGTGYFTQSGGTHTVENRLDLAFAPQSSGIYTLSGGALAVSTDEFVGQLGAGIFNHSGGTNSVGDELVLGHGSVSTGVYNLSGTGALVVQASEFIGSDGVGQFTQTGGTNVVGQDLFVGSLAARWADTH